MADSATVTALAYAFVLHVPPLHVIASVGGYALGGGLELALACDLIVASQQAKLGQPEVNLGIIPGYGGTQRLTRVIGRTYATDLILTGRQMSAQDAERHEIVSRVVPLAELMPTAMEMAKSIAAKAPLAVSAALECIIVGIEETIEEGLLREASHFGGLTTTEDFREGTGAFLQKRAAQFSGK